MSARSRWSWWKGRRSQNGWRRADRSHETLALARDIAEALEYAHERGIVHRDLKPANVKLTTGGVGQDPGFRVGESARRHDVRHEPREFPTISMGGTQAGVLLGTGAYMSPEQARGQPVDRRRTSGPSAVWFTKCSRGCQPFPGATLTDVLARDRRARTRLGSAAARLSPRVGSLLRRCLRKDPRDRLRDIGDARLEIDDIQLAPTLRLRYARRSWSPIAWLAPALAGSGGGRAGGVGSAWPGRSASLPQGGLTRLHAELPEKTVLSLGSGSAVALSRTAQRWFSSRLVGVGPSCLHARSIGMTARRFPEQKVRRIPFSHRTANGLGSSPAAD